MRYGGRDGLEVRVARAPLLACLTCPLCHYLIREATTISECLHTFCRDCITAELSHGESDCCPTCQVNLGTLPLEKLRADHQLNDLKEKLFPGTAKKRKPSPGTTSNASRRKERSLYSLGVKGPPAVNPGYASRKTRALPGTHTSSSLSSGAEEELELEGDDDDEEDDVEDEENDEDEDEEEVSDDSPTTTLKLSSHNGGSPDAKVYPHSEPRRRPEDSSSLPPRGDGELQLRGSMAPPWSTSKLSHPLSHRPAPSLANGNKSSPPARIVRGARKSNGSSTPNRVPRPSPLLEFPSALDALAQVANADAAMEETGCKLVSPSPPPEFRPPAKPVLDRKEGLFPKPSSSRKPRPSNGLSLQSRLKQTLNGVMDRPSILRNNSRKFSASLAVGQSSRSSSNGLWFHLESGDVQANEDALPPLASPYVRIKDGKLPVFQMKKYIVMKLAHKVKTEMEVEITCRGQPVVSSLPLESIRDIWFSAQISDQLELPGQPPAPGESSSAPANGSNAADFPTAKDILMVLTYRRHRKPRLN